MLLLLPFFGFTQNEIIEDSLFVLNQEDAPRVDMSFSFKTQNYFRGLLPSKAPTFSTTAGVVWDHFW